MSPRTRREGRNPTATKANPSTPTRMNHRVYPVYSRSAEARPSTARLISPHTGGLGSRAATASSLRWITGWAMGNLLLKTLRDTLRGLLMQAFEEQRDPHPTKPCHHVLYSGGEFARLYP